jgi:hypothetical protein
VIERYAAQGVGSDSVLVPFIQTVIVGTDTARYSLVVQIDQLAYRDTTYVRNSGNFRRSVVGEGGPILGSRAVMFDVTRGLQTTFLSPAGNVRTLPTPVVDLGVSQPANVTDYVANAYGRVGGVAINFDGELAAIRGDSTYVVDALLRLQGLLQTSGQNPGFDFHPSNAGIGPSTSPAGARVSFAASNQPEIQVYDTYTYRLCSTIPTRDPIIGPIKAAVQAGGTNVIIVGATARGLVNVTISQAQLATVCN